jgi:5-(carboxyamino)imidazole ribonucleotide synthase
MHKNDVHVHLYGKAETKPHRKMGHVTVLGSTMDEAMKKANFVKDTLKVIA